MRSAILVCTFIKKEMIYVNFPFRTGFEGMTDNFYIAKINVEGFEAKNVHVNFDTTVKPNIINVRANQNVGYEIMEINHNFYVPDDCDLNKYVIEEEVGALVFLVPKKKTR